MNRALSIAAVIFGVILIMPTGVLAQTQGGTAPNIQSLLEQIQTLLKQVQDLQNRIRELRAEQAQTISQISDLLTQLKEGDSGEKVKVLQALLAADTAIYPEGLITGFYGPLTKEAVKRFQRMHGIEQVGSVGPKTLKKLNELLEQHPVAFVEIKESDNELRFKFRKTDDDEDKDNRGRGRAERQLCAIVPPGHLIAPGWLKKHGKPLIPPCQVLPPGIAKKLGIIIPSPTSTTSTSTPDTLPPVISDVAAQNVTHNSASIIWTTNEPATSKVYYGTVNPLPFPSANIISSSSLKTAHSIPLTGLAASTTYYYVVESEDAAGNTATSSLQSFSTAATPDLTPPVITNVSSTQITSSTATIVWTTNESSTSKVYYSTLTPLNIGTASFATVGGLFIDHSVTLGGLTASTTYYYVAESADASGNQATSTEQSFTTPEI